MQQKRDAGLVVFALHVGHGVVAFAGLDLLAGLTGDVEGAEGAVVDLGVGGGVAGEVLGAELLLDLSKASWSFLPLLPTLMTRPPVSFARRSMSASPV